MADKRRVVGAAPILVGMTSLAFGVYYLLFYEEKYFVAEGIHIEPGERRAVFVVPNSKIVIRNYSAPFCEGSKLVLYNNYGNVIWESKGVARFGGEEVIRVTSCNTAQCTYYIAAVAPSDCTVQRYGSNALGTYTLYVVYKPRELSRIAYSMFFLGLVLVGAGGLALKIKPRKTIAVDDALIELARKQRMHPTSRESVVAELTLKPKGIRDREVSKLIGIVSEKKSVYIESHRSRFSNEYSIHVKGARDNVIEALKDFIWFCQATGKCELLVKKL